MANKQCSKCKCFKEIQEFYTAGLHDSGKVRISSRCKKCISAQRKEPKKPKTIEVMPSEKVCTKCGNLKPIDAFGARKRGKFGRNSNCITCMNSRALKWRNADPDRSRQIWHRWKAKDPDRVRALVRQSSRRRYENPSSKLRTLISNAVYVSLKGITKSRPTFTLLGYTRAQLMSHLQRQFIRGMSWKNYGDWHVDHIIPMAAFKIVSCECPEFKAAWALANLRPLWAEDNLAKSKKRAFLL